MDANDKAVLLTQLADTIRKTGLKQYFGVYAELGEDDKENDRMLINSYRQMFKEITAELEDCQGLLSEHQELRIAWIEKNIMFLNLMLDDEDCYNGFSKLCGKVIEDTTPDSEKRLYRGLLKQTIRDLADLKDKISFGAVSAEYTAADLP